MSQLQVSHAVAGTMNWKVTQFNSPMTATVQSAQTSSREDHYPIKASQQTIQFRVQASSLNERLQIQNWVRQAQVGGRASDTDQLVTLWWPQRNIDNWTGIPLGVKGGGERFLIASNLDIQFLLVDSMVSRRTISASSGTSFSNLIASAIPQLPSGGYPDFSNLTPPQNIPTGGVQPGINPVQPGVTRGPAQPGVTTNGG